MDERKIKSRRNQIPAGFLKKDRNAVYINFSDK